ncbi:sulfatase-like hydrolase/transferase [Microbacterium sp. SSW1-59]|uniref:sulfatase family protein n=1 Tax=Microbacterium xanthum TaxID=3079794 RepID=UPI002AD2F417|nr:sulfatase-like hydrolase/transferase [Microbacterium sp. SSW1-59]MDZ8201676.1 sulfatase-like hydrolase/transferase [Microbacterium sp. SSW1-59]
MSDSTRPNVLFVMTDQQRFDTLAALGNEDISTPNLDRLVNRGAVFDNAYATCPVCVPSRYSILSGAQPTRTGVYENSVEPGTHDAIVERVGPYLATAMGDLGYRTWGIGKFHTIPWDADSGFEFQLRSEEMYRTEASRAGDDYAAFIADEHPEYNWIEALMGERTDMYYMPQMSALPAEITVEAWATDRAIEQIQVDDERPWFGYVSYIGPHPPFAPPLPYNRMYDPDRMPLPVSGDLAVDHLDQQIPWMNHAVYAEDVDAHRARALKARYYGEISYIDACIGRMLDALEASGDADDTVICFYSDHGDHLGDHSAWQKESFFEASTRIPFLLSWPGRITPGERRQELACLVDLFGIATGAAGAAQLRQGVDILGGLDDATLRRDLLFGYHGKPGTERFKAMVRCGPYKLIWMSNGPNALLFDVASDPQELNPIQDDHPTLVAQLLDELEAELRRDGVDAAFDDAGLRTFDYTVRPLVRIDQFDMSRGVTGFPDTPADVHYEPPAGVS